MELTKWVRLAGKSICEILPDYATPPEQWYGPVFAAQCIEAPDEVEQGWTYDLETGAFMQPVEPEEDISILRTTKLSDLSAAGNAMIVAGVDVTLPSTGEIEHFALHETDQINLTTALTAVEMGAAGYPYHADGQLCRLYPAQDILAISQAAIAHKLYHTTYCNHLLVWVRRAETAEELAGITYGAELPEDLADNLAAVLAAAGGVADA